MSLEPGTTVSDRYRVLTLLGEGGMGSVYQAEHIYMKKSVALKVLHAEVASDPSIVARFEREAVAAGSIQHPNVATATDFGRLPDGSFFLVLEFVEGKSLRLEMEQGPISTARALRILRQVVEGVGAAHEKGIVHRDLKPDNIMLLEGSDDRVKVLDFGIAKMESGEPMTGAGKILTQTGQVFGTPDYMSPEQAMGDTIDKRTDFYALGVILYEMLAGKRPFEGGTMTLLRDRVLNDQPPPLPDSLPLDRSLRDLTSRLMARMPDARPSSAEEILAAINRISLERSPTMPPAADGIMPLVGGRTSQRPPDAQAASAVSSKTLLAPVVWRIKDKLRSVPRRTQIAAAVVLLLIVTAIGFGASEPTGSAPSSTSTGSASLRDRKKPAPVASEPIDKKVEPSDPEKASSDPESTSGRSDTAAGASSNKKKRKGASTGPGGIYIPPPDTWF